jgi:hypothetical protein
VAGDLGVLIRRMPDQLVTINFGTRFTFGA